MRELKDSKKDKLLQYAQNVWNISTDTAQDEDAIIEEAIVRTENFFKDLGLPISLADANLDESAIDPIIKQLEAHGMTKLGEHKANDLEVSRRILQRAAQA